MKRFLTACILLWFAIGAHAQYTNLLENGTNQTIRTAWDISGLDLVVGNATTGNWMQVVEGGSVLNADGYVGALASAYSNIVYVHGDGAAWTNAGILRVGAAGNADNAVWVYEGGRIVADDLAVAEGNAFNLSSGGTLAITGDYDAHAQSNVAWSSGGTLSVGGNLTGMTVSNGAAFLNGNRNLVLDGGTWDTGPNGLTVGLGSAGNLSTTNKGWVLVGGIATNGLASADGGIAAGSGGGVSVVVDNGSTLSTSGGFFLGSTNGLAGSAIVTNNGTIEAADLIVAAGSSLSIARGGTLSITGDYDADAQSNVAWNSGGTLSVGGKLTKSNGLDGTERTLVLDGGDWTPGGDFMLEGTGNRLTLLGGGALTNNNGRVAGTNNAVLVSGSGSTWVNNGSLYVATNGNSVTVQSGGRVEADLLDIATGGTFNLASGGTLAMSGDFNVASHGNLAWTSGGNLSVGGTLAGMGTTSNEAGVAAILDGGRDLTLDGPGAVWNLSGTNLVVGYNGSGSDLAITNGGTVRNVDGYIGWGGTSANNSATVSGAGSAWVNTGGALHVGAYWSGTNLVNAGGGNRLAVEDGGWVVVGEVQTNLPGSGLLVASANGALLVVGNGSVDVEGMLHLGTGAATTGTNIIRSGGSVSVGDLAIADGSYLDLQRGGFFAIGTNFNVAAFSANGFNWAEGGHLSVGGNLAGMATTNIGGSDYTYLDGERDLTLDGGTWSSGSGWIVGLDSANSELVLKNGARMKSGTTYIGWDAGSGTNSIALRSGSVWTNTGDLWIGHDGTGNFLLLADGATNVVEGNAYIGTATAAGNQVRVENSNTLWRVDNDLSLASGNTLALVSDGRVEVGHAMNVASNTSILGTGTIAFGPGNSLLSFTGQDIGIDQGIIFKADSGFNNTVAVRDGLMLVEGSNAWQYVNFQQLATTNSTLAGYGALDAFGTVDMQGGIIDPMSADSDLGRLEIAGNFTSSGTVYRARVDGDAHDELAFGGANPVDLLGLAADIEVWNAPTNLQATILSADAGLVNGFATTSLVDRLLLYDAFLDIGASTVTVRLAANDGKFSSSLAYAGFEGVRAGFRGMKDTVFSRTRQLRRNLVATAHAIPQEAYLMASTNAPTGAYGPGEQNAIFDMHLWIQQYGGQGDYDAQGASRAFTLNNNGTTIGADRLVGEALTLGLNYTYARSAARTSADEQMDSETYWLGAYGEWVGKEGLYVDALLAAGRSNYETLRLEENYRGSASYRGGAAGAYLDVGQYYRYKAFALAPYAGLHALYARTDGHTETESQGSRLQVEADSHTWLESALGLKVRQRVDTPIGRIQATGYAEWAHEFLQDEIYSTLSDNRIPAVDLARIAPAEDTFGIGAGLGWTCTDYMEIGVGYNGRFADGYEEHTGSLMLDLMF